MTELLHMFVDMVLVSVLSYGGGAAAMFYQFGVEQAHWVSGADLAAMLAFGYATPGPAVFSTGVFIGYRVGGVPGALLGTIGIFLVPWVGSIIAARHASRWLDHPRSGYVIRSVGLAAAGVVTSTAWTLFVSHSGVHVGTTLIALAAFAAVTRWKLHPLLVLAGGTLLGLLL